MKHCLAKNTDIKHKVIAKVLLVSTHLVCERLSVMLDLAWVRRFGTSHGGLSNFKSKAAKNTPPTPRLELLMGDLASLGLRLLRIPPLELELLMEDLVSLSLRVPRISPPQQGLELLMENLGKSGLRLVKNTPSPQNENFWTYMQGVVCGD